MRDLAFALLVDIATVCDGVVIVGVAMLAHIFVNVNGTPDATAATNHCDLWQPALFVMSLLAGLAAVGSAVTRAMMLRPGYEAVSEHPWGTLLFTEVLVALISVPTGYYMITSVKPEGWLVALHRKGCDIFSSPPALLGWVVGEILAVGSGIRLSIAIVGSCGGWEYKLAAAFALLVGGIGTTVLSAYVVDPWFEELVGANSTS